MMVGWLNKLDDAALTASGASPVTPVENLQVDPLGLAARFTGDTVTIDFDYGASTPWRMFALLPARQGFDLSPAATRRLTLSDIAPGGAEIYDSGLAGAGVLEGYAQVLIPLVQEVSARYGRLTVSDAGKSTLDFGRLAGYGGAGFTEVDHNLGRGIRWEHRGTRERTKGGQLIGATEASWRVIDFALELIDSDAMFDSLFELERVLGLTGNVLVMLKPWTNPQRESVYGPLTRISRMVQLTRTTEGKVMEVEERL